MITTLDITPTTTNKELRNYVFAMSREGTDEPHLLEMYEHTNYYATKKQIGGPEYVDMMIRFNPDCLIDTDKVFTKYTLRIDRIMSDGSIKEFYFMLHNDGELITVTISPVKVPSTEPDAVVSTCNQFVITQQNKRRLKYDNEKNYHTPD